MNDFVDEDPLRLLGCVEAQLCQVDFLVVVDAADVEEEGVKRYPRPISRRPDGKHTWKDYGETRIAFAQGKRTTKAKHERKLQRNSRKLNYLLIGDATLPMQR